ncbi:hypothetical protein Q5P01_024790 [Channa striata]|uniref:Uncharacterized protein n=1 Tax=Channa striata TaxID=64152 RepID=A0AA88IUC6_CHASR|nr:hypothetical protein Q5P01_024790 [Channa striata]
MHDSVSPLLTGTGSRQTTPVSSLGSCKSHSELHNQMKQTASPGAPLAEDSTCNCIFCAPSWAPVAHPCL